MIARRRAISAAMDDDLASMFTDDLLGMSAGVVGLLYKLNPVDPIALESACSIQPL